MNDENLSQLLQIVNRYITELEESNKVLKEYVTQPPIQKDDNIPVTFGNFKISNLIQDTIIKFDDGNYNAVEIYLHKILDMLRYDDKQITEDIKKIITTNSSSAMAYTDTEKIMHELQIQGYLPCLTI